MKKISIIVATSFAILAFVACTNEAEETPISFTKELTFTATQEGLSPETKTMRIEDGSTWWQPAEEISVFYGSGSNGGSKFTSKNNTLQEIVEFEGSITISGSGKDFWAVYPYSKENACDGNSITTVIPSAQMGSEGNFSGDAFPTIAKSNTLDLAFWNICGGIKFFVSRNDIESITFKGNNGETLAGKVKVAFNDSGVPAVTEVINGISEVTLAIPDGTPFKAGKYYYLTLLPGTLESGFTMTFNTATEQGTVVSNKPQTVKRSIFGVLKSIDSKVSEWESRWVEPEWVDLGLSVKWATFNVGASKPEDYGDHFAWGETEPKSEYTLSSYKWCNGSWDSFTKYNADESYGIIDNKTVLDEDDDVAHANWGDKWRMPTTEECKELIDNCNWTWTDTYQGTGVAGMIASSKVPGYTDKYIFLPAAGTRYDTEQVFYSGSDGFYFSLSLSPSSFSAMVVGISSYGVGQAGNPRHQGYSVRPIYGDRIHPESITLNTSSLLLSLEDIEQLTAIIAPENATDKLVLWSSDNPEVATVDINGNVTAVSGGSATITASTNDGNITASCLVSVLSATIQDFAAEFAKVADKWDITIGTVNYSRDDTNYKFENVHYVPDNFTITLNGINCDKFQMHEMAMRALKALEAGRSFSDGIPEPGNYTPAPSPYHEYGNPLKETKAGLDLLSNFATRCLNFMDNNGEWPNVCGYPRTSDPALTTYNGYVCLERNLLMLSRLFRYMVQNNVTDLNAIANIEISTYLWGETGTNFSSNVTWTSGSDSAYDQTAYVNGSEEIPVLKLGTSTKYGKSTLTLPAGSKKLSFYAVSWNNADAANLVFTVNGTQVATVTPKANSGLKSNAPYTLTVDDNDYYTINLGSRTAEVTVETSGYGCRAAIFAIVAE